ncbi:transposase [Microbacterium sp. NPDC077184]|uniref:transposase n=1 Tax=Microbacterium sp. NPDC077184 TaxID=3154764 RepID=UPI00342A49A5
MPRTRDADADPGEAARGADLDAIAAELYALAPERFTAARNDRAARLGRTDAARVRELRKPTVAAWVVSLAVRDGRLAEAITLSAALREAQDDADAAALAELGRQRRRLVQALAAEAEALAEEAGVTVSASARDDIASTINAAVMDAAAAAVVMTGRLVRPLVAGGFDPADLADAVGGSLPGVAPAPPPPDDLAERRARKAAERAAREADRAQADAERRLAAADSDLERRRTRLAHLRERADELRRSLDDVEAQTEVARAETEEAEAAHVELTAAAARAARAAEAAREALPGGS